VSPVLVTAIPIGGRVRLILVLSDCGVKENLFKGLEFAGYMGLSKKLVRREVSCLLALRNSVLLADWLK